MISFVIIAIPVGSYLALKTDLKLYGIWIGIMTGIACQISFYLYVVISANWELISKEAIEKIKKDGK